MKGQRESVGQNFPFGLYFGAIIWGAQKWLKLHKIYFLFVPTKIYILLMTQMSMGRT